MPLSSPPPTSSSSSISSSSRIRKYNNNYKQQNWIIITILFIVLLLCNNFVSSNTIRYDDLNSPYARGSPYGSSYPDANSVDTGSYAGVYHPMGNFHGFEGFTPPTVQLATSTTPNNKIAQSAYNYSTPWGDYLHPGVHPMWPIPPSPLGPQLNSQYRNDVQNLANAPDSLRYGIQGAHAFSAFRKYKFGLGQIPHGPRAWPYAGAPGGEPHPFLHTGKIPATWPNGRDTTGTIRASQSVLNPYGSNNALRAASFLEMNTVKRRRRSAYKNKRPLL
jgi:hypothetical protein